MIGLSKEDFIKKFKRECICSGGQFKKEGDKFVCIKEEEVKDIKKIKIPGNVELLTAKDETIFEFGPADFKLSGDDIKEISVTELGAEIELKQPIRAKIRGILKVDIREIENFQLLSSLNKLWEKVESDLLGKDFDKWEIEWKKSRR